MISNQYKKSNKNCTIRIWFEYRVATYDPIARDNQTKGKVKVKYYHYNVSMSCRLLPHYENELLPLQLFIARVKFSVTNYDLKYILKSKFRKFSSITLYVRNYKSNIHPFIWEV